jgi:hypothetical protein
VEISAGAEPLSQYKGALYLTVELSLYSPYGPYSLYTASVPVQGVHFTFTTLQFRMIRVTRCDFAVVAIFCVHSLQTKYSVHRHKDKITALLK